MQVYPFTESPPVDFKNENFEHLFEMPKNWTKTCQAQIYLDAMIKEGLITANMGSSQVKLITDPRIAELTMHSDSTLNRKIAATCKTIGF
jgi:hypothetical protein